jgi:hypothetical protein
MEENIIPEETQDNNRIVPINIEEQMKMAYIDYSMSVIVSRALPDVRDGILESLQLTDDGGAYCRLVLEVQMFYNDQFRARRGLADRGPNLPQDRSNSRREGRDVFVDVPGFRCRNLLPYLAA